MLRVIRAVEALPLGTDPLMGPALFALTDIISEPYPAYSVIPSRCRVTYDRRLLPGETADGVLSALPHPPQVNLQAHLAEGEHRTYTGQVLRGSKFFPAWVLDEAHPLVQRALRGLRSAGLTPRLGAYRFCTNAAYSAGVAGVPTIGFGPSAEGDAHVVDERIALGDLHRAAQGYRGLIAAICSAPEEKHV
jgi:acetylornithine deacetylase/succinyl-diaminopimelate desuccinylase-like protein